MNDNIQISLWNDPEIQQAIAQYTDEQKLITRATLPKFAKNALELGYTIDQIKSKILQNLLNKPPKT